RTTRPHHFHTSRGGYRNFSSSMPLSILVEEGPAAESSQKVFGLSDFFQPAHQFRRISWTRRASRLTGGSVGRSSSGLSSRLTQPSQPFTTWSRRYALPMSCRILS